MQWDEKARDRYLRWEESPLGRYALKKESHLLLALSSIWSRRRQKFLDIGCGTGFFLEMFWESGFNVTAIDLSPAMLDAARERVGSRVDLHLGSADHLPFDDNEFDYASLITVLEFCKDREAVLLEAARVARKGLLVAYLNRGSFYGYSHGRPRKGRENSSLTCVRWMTWFEINSLLKKTIGSGRIKGYSVLPGPVWTWRENRLFRRVNSALWPPWLGAFGALRVDLMPEKGKTPLFAFNTEPEAGI